MKIRNLALFTVAALLMTRGAYAQDEDVEAQEDPFREKAKYKDEDDEDQDDSEEGGSASADRSFGNSGEVVISAERLLGIARTARTTTLDGPDYKVTVDRAHLLLNGNGDPVGYSAPRIAFDYFASDGFSLGVALGYSSDSEDTLFLAAARGGYALMFGQVVGVWPRVGITFQDQKTSFGSPPGTDESKVTLLAASVEVPVVFVASESVAITLGPSLDLSFLGKLNPGGPPQKTDFSAHEIGFCGGMSMFF